MTSLLAYLRSGGHALRIDGDKLIVSGVLTDEERRQIREHKAELMALLVAEEEAVSPELLRQMETADWSGIGRRPVWNIGGWDMVPDGT